MPYKRSELGLDLLGTILSIAVVVIWPLWFNWIGVGIMVGFLLCRGNLALAHYLKNRMVENGSRPSTSKG